MQYEIIFKVIGCSCYTCLPRTVPAAQTAQREVAALGTGAPPVAQRLLTNTGPKTIHNIKYMQTKANKTMLELFYALQRSRGHKEHLKRS